MCEPPADVRVGPERELDRAKPVSVEISRASGPRVRLLRVPPSTHHWPAVEQRRALRRWVRRYQVLLLGDLQVGMRRDDGLVGAGHEGNLRSGVILPRGVTAGWSDTVRAQSVPPGQTAPAGALEGDPAGPTAGTLDARHRPAAGDLPRDRQQLHQRRRPTRAPGCGIIYEQQSAREDIVAERRHCLDQFPSAEYTA